MYDRREGGERGRLRMVHGGRGGAKEDERGGVCHTWEPIFLAVQIAHRPTAENS